MTRINPSRRRNDGWLSLQFLVVFAVLYAFGMLSQDHFCEAFSSSSTPSKRINQHVPFRMSIASPSVLSQSMFSRNSLLHQSRRTTSRLGKSSLKMVLSTPMDIIEQASTVNLLDDLIDESVRTSSRRPIIRQFDPSSGWIWRRWKGTIFSETWVSCVRNMLYAMAIFFLYKTYPRIIDNHFTGFNTLWGQLLSVTTFTLTFFVNQSYALWRKCTQLSRRLQGRLHDIGMNMATHAKRKTPETPDEPSSYTPEARQTLVLMSRYVRMFNLMCYASFTRSHRPLITPRGMRRLEERGLLTPMERETLMEAAIPPTQRHSAILMWMIRLFVEGRASGHIGGGDGFEQHTLDKFHIIRAQYGAIGDELQGRMPLAYAHIVQVLVDVILWTYPVMALNTGMSPSLVIVGTGLLTVSYQGLFDLAKQFLDPYDNENYGRGEDPLVVDTLIAETNAGSVRWLYGFEEMPFNAEQLRMGELYDTLLPVRGYTVEDLAQMEEDRIKKENEKEEERIREEEEKAKREEEDIREEEEKAKKEEEVKAEGTVEEELESVSFEAQQTESETDGADNVTAVSDSDSSNVTVTMAVTSDPVGIVKPVHKVTTVGGMPVSRKLSSDDGDADEGSSVNPNGNLDVANYLASLSPPLESDNAQVANAEEEVMEDDVAQNDKVPTSSLIEELIEEQRQEEIESLEAATASEDKEKKSDEEYNKKLAEIEEAIKELNSFAEADGKEDLQLVPEKKVKKKTKTAPKLEQTEEDGEEENKPRLTLEDYEVEVERIITEAKEEMLETEAILSTKSGLDPLDWDYDDEQLESIAYDESDDDGPEQADDTPIEIVDEEDLVVLEMDVDVDEIDPDNEIDPEHLDDIIKTLEILNLRPGLSAADDDEDKVTTLEGADSDVAGED